MSDQEIYSSEEYKARIERAERSLLSFDSQLEAIKVAAESIAYWQMRTVRAEELSLDIAISSNRDEL